MQVSNSILGETIEIQFWQYQIFFDRFEFEHFILLIKVSNSIFGENSAP